MPPASCRDVGEGHQETAQRECWCLAQATEKPRLQGAWRSSCLAWGKAGSTGTMLCACRSWKPHWKPPARVWAGRPALLTGWGNLGQQLKHIERKRSEFPTVSVLEAPNWRGTKFSEAGMKIQCCSQQAEEPQLCSRPTPLLVFTKHV